jgi:hypothetical protein
VNQQKRKILLGWIAGILGIVVVLVAAFPFWFNYKYKDILRERLPGIMAKATDSLYHVSVDDIEIHIYHRKVNIRGVRVWPDSLKRAQLANGKRLPGFLIEADIAAIDVEGIKWAEIIADKELSCRSISTVLPTIKVERMPDSLRTNKQENGKRQKMEGLSAGEISIVQPRIEIRDRTDADSTLVYLKGGSIRLEDWELNIDAKEEGKRFVFAKRGYIKLDSLTMSGPGRYYSINTGGMSFESERNSFSISNLSVVPAMGTDEFYRKAKLQKTMFSIVLPKITVSGLDWDGLLKQGILKMRKIELDRPSLSAYMSRMPPPDTTIKMGNYPHQLLLKSRMPIKVDSALIRGGTIRYTELNNKTRAEGTIPFNNVYAVMTNLTNIQQAVNADPVCRLEMKAEFIESVLAATFRIRLDSKTGEFEVEGSQSACDATKLNSELKVMALTDMKSLNVKSFRFKFRADDYKASGDFVLLYDDLKLRMYKADDSGNVNSNGLVSFIANTALLYPSNPMPGEAIRRVHVTETRDPYRSFFNLTWRTLLRGMLTSIGRNPQVAEIIVNRRQANAKKRRALHK